jgi:predicted alpha/beta-hydrolase family hydrolase
MENKVTRVSFQATKSRGNVSGLLLRPEGARLLFVFAHGAGAGMHNRFMDAMSLNLAREGIATLRYHFPYMEEGSKRPDPKPILLATVRSAICEGARHASGVPIIAGGKSMGGRMTSMAASEEPLEGVKGLVFLGFPLHPAGKPSVERAEHLSAVSVPMLFLQGTRDSLADLSLLKPICGKLGTRATLHVVDGADHSFRVPKKSGRGDAEVLSELAGVIRDWKF